MTGKYAKKTKVSVDRSSAEIASILRRYGATKFASAWDDENPVIMFEAHGRFIRFVLPMPNLADFRFTDVKRILRTKEAQQSAYEQELARRWRALALGIKAKLEIVESGISTFEDEFMAHIVLPDNSTVSQWMGPQIEQAYLTGGMPKMLLLSSGE